jgi:hypothetical protein
VFTAIDEQAAGQYRLAKTRMQKSSLLETSETDKNCYLVCDTSSTTGLSELLGFWI